jgi:hypothetical protein
VLTPAKASLRDPTISGDLVTLMCESLRIARDSGRRNDCGVVPVVAFPTYSLLEAIRGAESGVGVSRAARLFVMPICSPRSSIIRVMQLVLFRNDVARALRSFTPWAFVSASSSTALKDDVPRSALNRAAKGIRGVQIYRVPH